MQDLYCCCWRLIRETREFAAACSIVIEQILEKIRIQMSVSKMRYTVLKSRNDEQRALQVPVP